MRALFILATLVLSTIAARAAEQPTMDQCKAGYKASYSSMWTEADFKKACDSMMNNGTNSNDMKSDNSTKMKPDGKM